MKTKQTQQTIYNMSHKPILDPKDIPYRFAEAWNVYNPDGIANLFTEDADFVNVTGKWWNNKTDIWKAHDFGLRIIFQNSQIEILKVKVKNISDDASVIHCRLRVLGQTKNNIEGEAGNRETMFLFVAKRQENGEWLCISAQNTDIVFGMQTNIRDESGELKSVSYKEKKVRITKDLNEED